MDWGNESVLEFIELLQREPCTSDPKRKDRNDRNVVRQAWIRIRDNFTLDCPVEELKKKRNVLLTQYRAYLKKMKESAKTGEMYMPTWFAFDALHSYMGPVYDCGPATYNDTVETTKEDPLLREAYWIKPKHKGSISYESNDERSLSRELNSECGSYSFSISELKSGVKESQTPTKNTRKDVYPRKNTSICRKNEDRSNECALYGQLLAEKLKPLEIDDRLVLMNEIDNLVFKYLRNMRKRKASANNSLQSTI